MRTDQTLYRAGALEPIAGYDDVLFLIDMGGPISKYSTAFYGIQGIRPIGGMGPHGRFVIWTQGAAPPAGYGNLPQNAPTGSIAAGASVTYVQPPALALGTYGFAQIRFSLELLALTGAVSLQDIDLQVLNGSMGDYGLPQLNPGFYNLIDQFPSPSDQTVDPAQNANKALPAAYPQQNPWDAAQLTELYWFENNSPTFKLINNGGAAITGGTALLNIKGFRYQLVPLQDDGTWTQRFLAGGWRQAPALPRIITVPTVPPTGTTQF